MMDEESAGVELDLREAIAWCFMGVGAFSRVCPSDFHEASGLT